MREIKFRCWIKKEKRMDNVDFINFAAQFAGKWECKKSDADLFSDRGDEVATKRGRLFNLKDVEIMQFTGLKDKNGREIYEGDIVECISCKGKDRKYKVTWCDKFLGFVLEHKKEKYQISIFNDFKVIGNIYENPELLKEENND